MASKDKDYRLITLISDICPLPLRKFFLNLAQSDTSPGVPFTTLDTYMTFRKLDVTKSIRNDQYNLIYPIADETKWDVSLLSGLLLGLFGKQMIKGENQLIKIIREIRNKRQHKPGNLVTEDSEFDTVWNDIETATLTLAQIVGGRTYEDEIRSLIEDVKINNLPRLGDTLKTWYEDIIVQLRSEIEELKDTSNRSLGILEATTVKRKSSSGGKSKRQKIDDPVLKKLRGHFEQTLARELPEDFEPHEEEGAVRRKLRDNHYVVVSGHENTSYLATVLSVIKSSGNYLMSRCVEIKKLDDWRHVDPEETDLVIYCEPFHDRVVIDDPRSRRELCDTFQSMQDSAKMPDKESRVDVVIVSEHSMVEAWKEHNDMQLFEDGVELYRPTAEETPLDVEKRYKSCKRRGAGDVLGNMLAYSEAYIKQWRTDEIDQALMDSAREKFKKHKALVITGPKGSGKTKFAVNLVSTCYEENQCVVLTETSEWKHVILGEVSVIIIDEFAGKFKYNASTAEGWLNKFDLIYAAAVQGKVNVIVTSETSRFTKVLKTYSGHALLNHRIKMPGRGTGNITVKEEPLSPVSDSPDILEMGEAVAPTIIDSRENEREVAEPNVEENLPEFRLVSEKNFDVTLDDFCEMSDGTVVCLYNKVSLKETCITKFDIRNRETEEPIKLDYYSYRTCISFIEGQEIIIFFRNKMQHATVSDSGIELGELKNVPVYLTWQKVCVHGGKYIVSTNVSVTMYDQNWIFIHEITQNHDNKPLFYDSFPTSESIASKRRHITNITTGEELFFISSKVKIVVCNYDGDVTRIFPADANGIAVYSEQLLLTWSDNIVSFYSVRGKLRRMLLQEIHSLSNVSYLKKNKLLFLTQYHTLKIFSIGSGSI